MINEDDHVSQASIKKSQTEIGERLALEMLNNSSANHVSQSIFPNEEKTAKIWVIYNGTYWTLCVWIPTLIAFEFFTADVVLWCIGFCFMLGCCYTLNDGQLPSGATRDNKFGSRGIGRWTAFALTASAIADFSIMGFIGMSNGLSIAQQFRGAFHLFFIFWTSLFFYNKFRIANPQIATQAFFGEWIDVASTSAVIFLLHSSFDSSSGECLDQSICVVYFIVVLIQLIGWTTPMMCMATWGTRKGATGVSKHLLLLDIFTDVPVILAVLIEDAYRLHVMIYIDILWKSFLLIRIVAYYLVYFLWLRKGHRIFMRSRVKNRGDKHHVVAMTN